MLFVVLSSHFVNYWLLLFYDRRNNHLRDFAVLANVLEYYMSFYASPFASKLLRLNGNIQKRRKVLMVYLDLICINQNIFKRISKIRICRDFMFYLIMFNIITASITETIWGTQTDKCRLRSNFAIVTK